MVLYVVAVGRVRDAALREACAAYVRRLRRRQRLDLIEVREAGRQGSAAAVLAREADGIVHALPRNARAWALTRRGTLLDSRGFARQLAAWREEARDVALVIGGAYGLHRHVLERCEGFLSLSPLTLPHDLARLVLLEQLYRADTMLRGEPYHKESPAP